jgi:SAM-dependent methyltransferase
VFAILTSLIAPAARTVLDAGCGVGDLARPLAPLVDRVDAVDPSSPMLVRGAGLPGGGAMNLRWIHSGIESAVLRPPYGLIVCGDSVHWFDWSVALTRFSDSLAPGGCMAIVQRNWSAEADLQARLRAIYARHGANPDFRPLDPVTELERRGLFERAGEHVTAPATWSPTLETLIVCHHSQNGFVLEKMRDPGAFDRELADVMGAVATDDGRLALEVVARIVWGKPIGAQDAA